MLIKMFGIVIKRFVHNLRAPITDYLATLDSLAEMSIDLARGHTQQRVDEARATLIDTIELA